MRKAVFDALNSRRGLVDLDERGVVFGYMWEDVEPYLATGQ